MELMETTYKSNAAEAGKKNQISELLFSTHPLITAAHLAPRNQTWWQDPWMRKVQVPNIRRLGMDITNLLGNKRAVAAEYLSEPRKVRIDRFKRFQEEQTFTQFLSNKLCR
ncbi:unnamed protein product [Brassica rapa]|uniref:Uncharacterized protein n=2 Tax=Brassica TaxID=3705 RepID=A0A3P5Z5I2_BRACM|nr:unnamed protein product [Brassica napus]CAG7887620.1 unnamed protein product [Brassica rapa]CDY55722.1 BnaA01g35220D [Brassica napus]VDC75122.1 unnamed protein product [Brassica rapa]